MRIESHIHSWFLLREERAFVRCYINDNDHSIFELELRISFSSQEVTNRKEKNSG